MVLELCESRVNLGLGYLGIGGFLALGVLCQQPVCPSARVVGGGGGKGLAGSV